MTPLIHPRLVNDPFGDPGLFLEFKFQRQAMLFDLGDLSPLAPRDLLRVSDVFVSHAHMDHFSGFDRLLRICLGRDKRLRLYGPPGFIDKVEHKLAAYDWNLIHKNPSVFTIETFELRPDQTLSIAEFSTNAQFRRSEVGSQQVRDGVLLDESGFQVRAVTLDHGIPSLAFRIDEPFHVNVWRNRLAEIGLGVGPWLKDAKSAIICGAPDNTELHAIWSDEGKVREAHPTLGLLKAGAITLTAGQKVAYVVDTVFTPQNADKIVAFARAADILYIETTFMDEDVARASDRYHLTAGQAGEIARRAGVRKIVPFHFSPRYLGREDRLRQEALEAFVGKAEALEPAGPIPSSLD
ncbi:MAG: MBL fold metallo-hydrolase [Alphaproteobacteria bacterium]